MSWRVARTLDTLLAEINTAAPNRSKASDGSIGDTAHSSRASDHNPNGFGVVRARDFTHDPAMGLNCYDLADHLAPLLGKHRGLGAGAYIIWQGRIISTDRIAEGWRTYTGSNPHNHHLHLSCGRTNYDTTRAYGWPPKPPTLPQRVVRYLSETLAIRKELTREIQRLKAARAVAKRKGEPTGKYTRAIRQTREARKTLRVAREAARRVPKR